MRIEKGCLILALGILLSLPTGIKSFAAELPLDVEENYREMGMSEEEIISVKDELKDVGLNNNYITNTEKEFYIRQGIKTEDMEKMQEEANQSEGNYESDDQAESLIAARASHGSYPIEEGTILVTKDKVGGVVPLGHAAIVTSRDWVVEAHPLQGVHYGKNNWNVTRNTCYGLKVHTLSKQQRFEVASWCGRKNTLPYNFKFYNVETRSAFYCSHLVWAGFKDKYNVDLNGGQYGKAIYPPEMIDSGYVYRIYIK